MQKKSVTKWPSAPSCYGPLSVVARGTTIQEHIVIGTPGTVLDWGIKLKIFDPKKIRVFVLDEADVMIATQGHQDQSIRIQRQDPQRHKHAHHGSHICSELLSFIFSQKV